MLSASHSMMFSDMTTALCAAYCSFCLARMIKGQEMKRVRQSERERPNVQHLCDEDAVLYCLTDCGD